MATMRYTGSVKEGSKEFDTYRDSKNREWYSDNKSGEMKMAPDTARKAQEERPPMSRKWNESERQGMADMAKKTYEEDSAKSKKK